MSITMTTVILFAVFGILLFLGVPISISIVASSIVTAMSTLSWDQITFITMQKMNSGVESFSLLAVPLFILAGNIMNNGGIAKRLVNFAQLFVGKIPGSMAQANILGNMLFGALSGSSVAAASAMGGCISPIEEENGYDPAYSAAANIASAPTGLLIPPTSAFIVYSTVAGGVSISTLFMAGYIPGILMSISMMIVVAIISKKRNYPTTRDKFPPIKEVLRQAFISFWGLFFPFGIILGMRFGMFTPSEGGAVAVLYCFVIGKLVYKRLSFRKHFVPIVLDTIAGTSSVVLIMVSASVFGQYMTWINLPKIVTTAVLNLTSNKYVFLLLTNVILLIMGMFLEGGAALMIITPLLLPVARSLGIGVYHFGLVAIVNIMIGGITPPFGSMMFTTCGITKCPISDFLKEVWPFIVCLVLVLLLLTFFPTLINIVPDLIYGAEGGI